MEQMQSLLSSHQNRHLIIGASIVQFEAFIKKAFDDFLHFDIIHTISYENIVIKTVFNKTMSNQQCLFINTPSLALFFKAYYSYGLDSLLDLKTLSLTLLEPQLDYSHIELFSNCYIYAIKGWDYNCKVELNEIDLSALPPNLYIRAEVKKKEKIFNIQKMMDRKKNKTKKVIIKGILKKEKTLGANSLISISNEIKLYVQRKQCVTLSQLIQYIIEYVRLTNKSNLNKKEVSLLNIHRRVYDSVNIMCALGIMKKENNHIIWINKDDLSSSSCIAELWQLNQLKKQQLNAKLEELNLYTHFYQRNKSNGQSNTDANEKVFFPIKYINQSENNNVISSTDLFEKITSSLKKPQSSKESSSNDYSTDSMSKNLPSVFDIDFSGLEYEDQEQDFFFKQENDTVMDVNEYSESIF